VTTWNGWQAEFLNAAHLLVTPPNIRFLTDWAAHANSPSCRNNPIDLYWPQPGSGNCVKPAGFSNWTQHYATHATAAHAFSLEIHTADFAAIRRALNTGNIFQQPADPVVQELRAWGSTNFATWYSNQRSGTGGGGGGGQTGIAPNTHKAWHDLQRAINDVVPAAVRDSQRLRRQTLRDIAKARKVRH
jgi:hypothetical protein